jgi:hypothetical protein
MARASILAAASIGLATLAGCTPSESPDSSGTQAAARPAPRCFSARDARSFRTVNSTTVNVRVGRDVYRLDLIGVCPDFAWTNRLGLVTRGSSRICTGPALGASIVARGTSGTQRCAIRQVTALTPEEVAALSARERP